MKIKLYTDCSVRGDKFGISFRIILPTHVEHYTCAQSKPAGCCETEAFATALYYIRTHRPSVTQINWYTDSTSAVDMVTGKCTPRTQAMKDWRRFLDEYLKGVKVYPHWIKGHVPNGTKMNTTRRNFMFVDQKSRRAVKELMV